MNTGRIVFARSLCALVLALTATVAVRSAVAQCVQELQRVTCPDGPIANNFGIGIGLSGELAAIGANGDDVAGENAGVLYVFRFDGSSWGPEVSLTPNTASANDLFGRSVASSGNFAITGGPGDDPFGDRPNTGSVAVFLLRDSDNVWTQDTTLNADDAATDDLFGTAVAMEGDVIVVGAPGKNEAGTLSGAAYVFRRDVLWTQEGKFVPADHEPFKFFGDSVAVSGGYAAIGAAGDSQQGDGAGAVYMYHYDGDTGMWSLQTKLLASDGTFGAGFGKRVAMRRDLLIVTADGAEYGGPSFGAAYIFRRDANGDWIEEDKLIPETAEIDEAFGTSAAIEGDLALVGSVFQDDDGNEFRWAYLFRNDDGWSQVKRIEPESPVEGEIFNFHLALDGDTALIGSFNRSEPGGAYFFDVSGCVGGLLIGDVNCDGVINFFDIDPFLLALFDPAQYAIDYPDCDVASADTNEDGSIDFFDIDPFVSLLFGG